MHILIAPIVFGTLTLTVLIGIFIIVKNGIKIGRFSTVIKKKLIQHKLNKLALLKVKLPVTVLRLLPQPVLQTPTVNPKVTTKNPVN